MRPLFETLELQSSTQFEDTLIVTRPNGAGWLILWESLFPMWPGMPFVGHLREKGTGKDPTQRGKDRLKLKNNKLDWVRTNLKELPRTGEGGDLWMGLQGFKSVSHSTAIWKKSGMNILMRFGCYYYQFWIKLRLAMFYSKSCLMSL